MVINQGDVYWLDLGTPLGSAPGYRRPFVIIQNNAINHSQINTVVICALTSNLKRAGATGNVLLGKGEAGLVQQSVIVVSQLFTIDKTRLDEYVGTLSQKRIRQILDGLRLITEPRDFA